MKKPSSGYRILKSMVNLLVSALVNINASGYKNFDKNQQYVIVSNHTSWLDVFLVIAKTPRTFQIVLLAEKAGAHQNKFIKFLIKKGDLVIIEIDRADQASRMTGLRLILKKAKEGYPIVIMPEGRINYDSSRLYPFYTGVFFIAVKTGLPILPLYIRGTSKIYFRRKINVNFGTPLTVEKGETAEDVAIKTYYHLLDNVQPEEPINKRKKIKHDLTKVFLGDFEYPLDNTGRIIADGREANNLFKEANEDSQNKFVKAE